MSLNAVIFDMDGVLIDTFEYHFRSWKKVFDEQHIPFSRQDNQKLLGLTRRRSLELILGEKIIPEERMQEILHWKNAIFLELISSVGPDNLSPGVGDLLQELSTVRIPLAVASASRNARLILQKLGIGDYFQVIVDGNAVLSSKPAPDVFLHAARQLDEEPVNCLVIEDSAAGVQAALSVGMCVAGVGPPHRVGRAHAILPDLAGLRLKDLLSIYDQFLIQQLAQKLGIFEPWLLQR